jgi:hypothetical protein
MYSSKKRLAHSALFAASVAVTALSLASAPAGAAHHVKRHGIQTQTHYQYTPDSERAHFPWTIDDFNVNGG